MLISLNKTSQLGGNLETSFLSLGYAFSHPLMCSVPPFNAHEHLDNSTNSDSKAKRIPTHTFEWMLTRSTHNNDYKGLRSLRNIELFISKTEIAVNFNKIAGAKEWVNFRHG
jgi:hypothetical protein